MISQKTLHDNSQQLKKNPTRSKVAALMHGKRGQNICQLSPLSGNAARNEQQMSLPGPILATINNLAFEKQKKPLLFGGKQKRIMTADAGGWREVEERGIGTRWRAK